MSPPKWPVAFPLVSHPILKGAEPFARPGGPGGVLVLHGFTGNPQSMRPIAEALADEGLAVDLPLLDGHGTDVTDMLEKRWSDWTATVSAALSALEERCEAVAVVGLSMGGSLACWLAENRPEITAVAVVNPMIDPPAEDFRAVVKSMIDAGEDVAPGIGSDIAKPGVAELAYPGSPLKAALSFFEGVDDVAANLASIACPVLLLTSRQDHVVDPKSSELLKSGASGRVEQHFLEKSFHVATLDYDADEVTERIVDFCVAHLPSGGEK
jgi:carboxylesterase